MCRPRSYYVSPKAWRIAACARFSNVKLNALNALKQGLTWSAEAPVGYLAGAMSSQSGELLPARERVRQRERQAA